MGKSGCKNAARSVFSGVLDIILVETALFRDFLEQLIIIAGDAKGVGCLPMVRPPLPNSRLMVITRFLIFYNLLFKALCPETDAGRGDFF